MQIAWFPLLIFRLPKQPIQNPLTKRSMAEINVTWLQYAWWEYFALARMDMHCKYKRNLKHFWRSNYQFRICFVCIDDVCFRQRIHHLSIHNLHNSNSAYNLWRFSRRVHTHTHTHTYPTIVWYCKRTGWNVFCARHLRHQLIECLKLNSRASRLSYTRCTRKLW